MSFDTGAVYRAITLKLIEDKIDPRNTDKLTQLLNDIEIQIDEQMVTLDNVDVSDRIRQMDITLNSAYIATRDKVEIAAKSILRPKDAFKINTDNLTFEEVSEKITQITMQRMNAIER